MEHNTHEKDPTEKTLCGFCDAPAFEARNIAGVEIACCPDCIAMWNALPDDAVTLRCLNQVSMEIERYAREPLDAWEAQNGTLPKDRNYWGVRSKVPGAKHVARLLKVSGQVPEAGGVNKLRALCNCDICGAVEIGSYNSGAPWGEHVDYTTGEVFNDEPREYEIAPGVFTDIPPDANAFEAAFDAGYPFRPGMDSEDKKTARTLNQIVTAYPGIVAGGLAERAAPKRPRGAKEWRHPLMHSYKPGNVK